MGEVKIELDTLGVLAAADELAEAVRQSERLHREADALLRVAQKRLEEAIDKAVDEAFLKGTKAAAP